MPDTYGPKVYHEQGGDRLVVAPGGELLMQGAIRGLIKGQAFYVDSATGSNANDGTNWTEAVATLDYAVGLCTAGRGDIIYLAPGHAETGTAAAFADLDVAGITVIGIGSGSLKPTFTFGTATTCDWDIDAANITVRGVRFVNNIDSLAAFIDCNSDYFTIEDCEFVTSSTKEAVCFISMATTKDYLTVRRCRFEQPTDPAGTDGAAETGCIYLVDSEYILIEDCWFSGCFETAIIHNLTTACKHLWVRNCFGIQALSGAEPFQLVAGATGGTVGGGFITPAETGATEATLAGTVGNGFFFLGGTTFGNDGDAGGQGGIIPATAS
jgi:hypothetical protein